MEYNNPPIIRSIQEIGFESLSNKTSGIFVVDFIGNGVSSRAIIKKGRLTVIDKITPAGSLFHILDENLEICKGSSTGIFVEGKFYNANEEGKIMIPFANSTRSVKAIL